MSERTPEISSLKRISIGCVKPIPTPGTCVGERRRHLLDQRLLGARRGPFVAWLEPDEDVRQLHAHDVGRDVGRAGARHDGRDLGKALEHPLDATGSSAATPPSAMLGSRHAWSVRSPSSRRGTNSEPMNGVTASAATSTAGGGATVGLGRAIAQSSSGA